MPRSRDCALSVIRSRASSGKTQLSFGRRSSRSCPITSTPKTTELLPWLEQRGGLSPEAGRKVRAYHDRLRTLIGAMANAGADRLTEAQAREVGRALSGIAVSLDDAIDNEERRLFPTIQKALFGIDHRP